MEYKLMVKRWSFVMILFIMEYKLMVSNGCVEDERMSLLDIKAFFLSYNSTSSFEFRSNPFPSWVGANCCNWDGVICNSTSGGHVVELLLYSLLDYPYNYYSNISSPNYLLNVSLFQNFKKLKILDLSENWFSGFTGNQGFNQISSFNKLETLDLSLNKFGNKIFSSLNGITSLKKLVLFENGLEGSIILPDIAKLKSLEFLDLSYNEYYDGVIPLQDLKNLKVLNLTRNQFNGSLPIQGFCETDGLIELKIARNQISDQLSECVGNFSKLKILDLSYNQFRGKIPNTIFNLTSMENLNFVGNYFEGSFSLSLLVNHSKLKYLNLAGNNFGKFHVETEEPPQWNPTFQLEDLLLRDCNLNTQSSSMIPTFLVSQHELLNIDIAHNQLVGIFPLWLLHNNSKLEHLDLSDNSFTGSFRLPIWKHNLIFLQISGNKFSGLLPKDMGLFLPQLEYFNVSRNSFEGNLPPSMQQMKNLLRLDLSSNKFYGNLQISMFNGMPLLQILVMTSNNFSGSIQEYGLKNNTELIFLDISNNMMSGKIPIWIGSFKGLEYINISNNLLTGELPKELCSIHYLQLLDVSQNQLVGGVPSCFNVSFLACLFMQQNYLSGPLPRALLSTASRLKVLDLSSNNFSGHIPNWINNFRSLRVLLLRENKLQGPIPLQLCQVGKISIMDLSNNELIGSIPSCLNDIRFGAIKANFTMLYLSSKVIYSSMPNTLPGQITVDFTAKYRNERYKSYILDHMSGLDLSNNKLTGQIPQQIGSLVQIRALNFSHNKLVGPIPKEFAHLKQLESLDLSHNLLGGNIPVELGGIDSLSIFNVSYNNLSGMIPSLPKFSSYPESSYYGNSHLCGLYIQHKCSGSILPPSPQPVNLEEEVHGVFIDIETFFWSFGASYVVILLGLVAVLYINPQWRQRWFYFIEDCYYYVCKCIS